MSCEPTAITGSGARRMARPGWPAISGRRSPMTVPGLPQRGEQPRREAGPLHQPHRPGPGPDIVELRGGRVGQLRADLAGEPVGEQVGDQQQGPGRGQLRRPRGRGELVDRVDRQLLHPGGRVQLLGWDLGEHLRDHALGPRVPVVHRVAEQRAAAVEQAVVHAPGVDAHAGQVEGPRRGPQPVQHLPVEPQDVPVQGAQHADRDVREPVGLMQLQLAGATWPDHDPAAGRAQVHGGYRGFGHRGCLSAGTRQPPQRPPGCAVPWSATGPPR